MFLKYLEWFSIAVAVVFIITQLVLPAWRGLRLFPLFRRQGKLESQLTEKAQNAYDSELQTQIDTERTTQNVDTPQADDHRSSHNSRTSNTVRDNKPNRKPRR